LIKNYELITAQYASSLESLKADAIVSRQNRPLRAPYKSGLNKLDLKNVKQYFG
jgi:hypothetical protein